MNLMADDLKKAKDILRAADRVVFLTGAGMSAESGVPTFRGKDGLWKNFTAEELATPDAFAKDPKTVWEWYDWRRSLIKPLKPNPGHIAIARIEDRKNVDVITQNVDGLHFTAGSKNVYELHGNIWKVRCTSCKAEETNRDVPIEMLPKCKNCGGLLRPAVVWFGETLNPRILSLSTELLAKADATVVVGTSGLVQPAASMAMYAKSGGSKVIEVNIDRTPNFDLMDVFIVGKAAEVLPQILEV